MIPNGAVKVDALESPNDPNIPQNASDVSCVKEDRTRGGGGGGGGERERKVESENRDYGRGTRTHEHKSFQRDKFYQKHHTVFVYNLPFYRN